jgi:UDP-N-acetylmuramoyl-tripeptide--D-alanyl-D-alanine ligase
MSDSSGSAIDPRAWGVSLAELAAALGLAGTWPDRSLSGVCTDSRLLRSGDLFVALAGERVDGHQFVSAAAAAGAGAVLVERAMAAGDTDLGVPALQVASTIAALARLAGWWRQRIAPQLIAITGSNGKTTVKELVGCILATDARLRGVEPQTELLVTQGNFNNHLGLPLTLLRLRPGHRRAVVELGMNHPGELTTLSALARPQVALINNVQRAHVGLLGSLAAVARAKGEIFSGLAPDGTAVINADDPHADALAAMAGARRAIRFSAVSAADVGPLLDARAEGTGQRLHFSVAGREYRCQLPLPGRHNASNLLAAIAAVLPLGVSVETACAAVADFPGVPGRLRTHILASGARVIDDTYNANPDSVLAALAVLAAQDGRRILVLGDLGELGEGAPAMHAEMGRAARAAGVDSLYGLGSLVAEAARAFGAQARVTEDAVELIGWLKPDLDRHTTVLIKGSRFMRMERIVAGLTE